MHDILLPPIIHAGKDLDTGVVPHVLQGALRIKRGAIQGGLSEMLPKLCPSEDVVGVQPVAGAVAGCGVAALLEGVDEPGGALAGAGYDEGVCAAGCVCVCWREEEGKVDGMFGGGMDGWCVDVATGSEEGCSVPRMRQ